MTRSLVALLLISLLLTSIDGAIDIAKVGHPHDDAATRQADVSDAFAGTVDTSKDDDGTRTTDHCEHCCHGHISVVMPNATPSHSGCGSVDQGPYTDAAILNFAQAPPTPPPNV